VSAKDYGHDSPLGRPFGTRFVDVNERIDTPDEERIIGIHHDFIAAGMTMQIEKIVTMFQTAPAHGASVFALDLMLPKPDAEPDTWDGVRCISSRRLLVQILGED